MVSQHLQKSEWWTTETSPSHHHDLLKITNEKKIVPNDTYTVDINQYDSNEQKHRRWISSNKLLRCSCCRSLSPCFGGLVLGVLTLGLVLAIVIALWSTSYKHTLTTGGSTTASTITSTTTSSNTTTTTSTTASTTTTFYTCSNFTVTPNWDYSGNDIMSNGSQTFASCCTWCLSVMSCVAFTFNPWNTCLLKYSTGSGGAAFQNSIGAAL